MAPFRLSESFSWQVGSTCSADNSVLICGDVQPCLGPQPGTQDPKHEGSFLPNMFISTTNRNQVMVAHNANCTSHRCLWPGRGKNLG